MKPLQGAMTANKRTEATKTADPQVACGSSNVAVWPAERIDRLLRPTDGQKQKLEALRSAAARAADMIKAACLSETPATPPGRLAGIGKRLQAQLDAVHTVEAPLKELLRFAQQRAKSAFQQYRPAELCRELISVEGTLLGSAFTKERDRFVPWRRNLA